MLWPYRYAQNRVTPRSRPRRTSSISDTDMSERGDVRGIRLERAGVTDVRYPATAVDPDGVERWNGPYVRKLSQLQDPWGNDLVMQRPGENGPFDIISYGADGRPGGEGDDGQAAEVELGDKILVTESKRRNDRGCNAQRVEGDLVLVRFLVAVQQAAHQLEIPVVGAVDGPVVAGVDQL